MDPAHGRDFTFGPVLDDITQWLPQGATIHYACSDVAHRLLDECSFLTLLHGVSLLKADRIWRRPISDEGIRKYRKYFRHMLMWPCGDD